jgi:cellulose synthase (UDP-forming)
MTTTALDPRLRACPWRPNDRLPEIRRKLFLLIPLNVILAAWYFGWLCRPGRVGNPILFGLLLLCELFNLTHGLGFWWTALRARTGGPARPEPPESLPGGPGHPAPIPPAVDVLIPVYDEPIGVVEPTVVAARRMRGAETCIYVLDDKGREELAAMARRLGARYVRRTDHCGAKAGNLNNALRLSASPLVAVFDCDHVPHPGFLDETMPALQDPNVAFVQTPQYYANHGTHRMAAAAWSQQALFFGIIAQGKAGLRSMFCCGTNVLFRRAALDDVGGFPEESLTEDFLLSVRMHERGWETAYVPRVLAQGLGPEDAASYVGQQRRWAKGCIAAIPVVLRAKLPWRQRIQYLLSASYFLSGWTILVYLSLPMIRILTGQQPLAGATAAQFLGHFIPYYTLCISTVAVAGAGTYTFAAFCVSVSNFWIHVDATVAALLHRRGGFVVTPKHGSAGRQPAAVAPALNAVGLLVVVAASGLIVAPTPATLNNVAFAAFQISLLLTGAWPALAGEHVGSARRPLNRGGAWPALVPKRAGPERAGSGQPALAGDDGRPGVAQELVQ